MSSPGWVQYVTLFFLLQVAHNITISNKELKMMSGNMNEGTCYTRLENVVCVGGTVYVSVADDRILTGKTHSQQLLNNSHTITKNKIPFYR